MHNLDFTDTFDTVYLKKGIFSWKLKKWVCEWKFFYTLKGVKNFILRCYITVMKVVCKFKELKIFYLTHYTYVWKDILVVGPLLRLYDNPLSEFRHNNEIVPPLIDTPFFLIYRSRPCTSLT